MRTGRIPETMTDQMLREAEYDLIGEYRKAVSLARFAPLRHVLDVGTGSARMAAVLAQADYTVLSGDIDSEALARARARLHECGADGVILFTLNAECMPFDGNTYASVVCSNAIHHFENPAAVLSEMARVCEPNGKLLLIEFNETGFEMLEKIHKHRDGGEHSRGILGPDGIQAQLSAAFDSVEHHQMDLNNVWISSGKKVRTDSK